MSEGDGCCRSCRQERGGRGQRAQPQTGPAEGARWALLALAA